MVSAVNSNAYDLQKNSRNPNTDAHAPLPQALGSLSSDVLCQGCITLSGLHAFHSRAFWTGVSGSTQRPGTFFINSNESYKQTTKPMQTLTILQNISRLHHTINQLHLSYACCCCCWQEAR